MISPPEAGGLKNWVPVAGILPALVPGMVDAALVALREYGTKSFAEVVQPAIELADGFPDRRNARQRDRQQREVSRGVARFASASSCPNGRAAAARRDLPPARSGAHAARHGGSRKESAGRGRQSRKAIDAVRDYFYRGEIAHRIDAFSKAHNGLLRYEDMAAFRVEPEEPVSTTFKGYTVYKPGFWSQGPA